MPMGASSRPDFRYLVPPADCKWDESSIVAIDDPDGVQKVEGGNSSANEKNAQAAVSRMPGYSASDSEG
ncbi:hypothetical protein N7540_006053 [Penicillium herquei]|nr:hypothetical protein N7540_006053 [Penicillium herquei]